MAVNPKFVNAAAAVVAPVPPFARGNVPVTPGLGEAAKIPAALVLARLTNNDGAAVKPVPPFPTANVPVTPGATLAVPSKVAFDVLDKLVQKVLPVAKRVALPSNSP